MRAGELLAVLGSEAASFNPGSAPVAGQGCAGLGSRPIGGHVPGDLTVRAVGWVVCPSLVDGFGRAGQFLCRSFCQSAL